MASMECDELSTDAGCPPQPKLTGSRETQHTTRQTRPTDNENGKCNSKENQPVLPSHKDNLSHNHNSTFMVAQNGPPAPATTPATNRRARREQIHSELGRSGYFSAYHTDLINYVPDFDAPVYDVWLLLEVASRRRGLTLLKDNLPSTAVYMTGWDLHQWGSSKIVGWMMRAGVHHDAAKYIADDIRSALVKYQCLHMDEFKASIARRQEQKRSKEHASDDKRLSFQGFIVGILTFMTFLILVPWVCHLFSPVPART